MALKLRDYFVSETHGFALENPLAKLPGYFEPWNTLATQLPDLLEAGTLRHRVHQLPLLDWTRLEGHRQKRLGHLELCMIASAYVWQDGEDEAAKILPACVAVPLHGLSGNLGLPPIICHNGLALANYAAIDPTQPLELGNLRALCFFPGGEEFEWFVIVTVAVELAFAKGIKSVMSVLEGVRLGDEQMVINSLTYLTQMVKDMQKTLSRMHDKLSADTFFNKFRPFLSGWGGENNALPDGLIYEGVSDQPIQAIGGSAAQSSTVQVLDALLGVQHSSEKRSFLLTMRSYMGPAHSGFIEAVENQPESLRSMMKNSTNEELSEAYNTLLSAMVDFRSYHIQIVTKYIVQSAVKARKEEENKFESLDKKGTGGTSILPFLKELRKDTKDQMTNTHGCTDKQQ